MNIGTERSTGASGSRPNICALNDGRVLIAFDNWSSMSVAMEGPSGFTVNRLAYSSKTPAGDGYNGSRVYAATIATDGTRFVQTARVGIKEWGSESVYGPVASNGAASKSIAFCKGAARVAYDPKAGRYVVLSKDGACMELTGYLDVIGCADMSLGSSGEKLALAIGSDGRRHAVMSGYSKQGSSYIVTGGKRIEWASYSAYPDMSPDENYPGLCLMNSNKAFVCAVYGGHLRYNIIKGGVCQKNSASLPTLGAATKGDRIGPAAVRAPWGVRVFWQAGASVVMGQAGKASQVICGGSEPTAVWNAFKGCISLAYVKGGQIYTREIGA